MTASRATAATGRAATLPPGPPLLQVVVDTEEEFDWGAPFDRNSVSVRAIEAQPVAQEIFRPYALVPTYVIDYPVATTPSAVSVLRSIQHSGQCIIGTHLHPWVTPPAEERVTTFNSYPGNLPPDLEQRKLEALTAAIADGFGTRPTIYKAGRYGLGPATLNTLIALGYDIDLSVVPHTDLGADGGPDFRRYPAQPHWLGPHDEVLEIPLSRGFSGPAAALGPAIFPAVEAGFGRALHLGGVLARSGLLERATLTPEGNPLAAQKRLLRAMIGQGHRVFSLTYHSPSLMPGCTPYVRDAADLRRFLDSIRGLLDFFFGELGGRPTTPYAVRDMARAQATGDRTA